MPTSIRVPKLRQHVSGNFLVEWGGRVRYLGKDRKTAEARYQRELQGWLAWREQRDADRKIRDGAALVVDLVASFLDQKRLEGGDEVERYYRLHLKRFLHACGGFPASSLTPRHVQALKDEMLDCGAYAPRTINHDIGTIKTFVDWAVSFGHLPPISLKGVRKLPVPVIEPDTLTVKKLRALINAIADDEQARWWLSVNYLTVARPSEVVRMINGEGTWVDTGILRLVDHKTARTARRARYVVFSPQALRCFKRCAPVWSRLDSYSSAVRRVCEIGPKLVQKCARTHLDQLGVDWADAQRIQGHSLGAVNETYVRTDWRRLRQIARRLAL